MLNPSDCDFLFIGFDCALRTLGWAILGYNPSIRTNLERCRELYQLFGAGVVDVLGENVESVRESERARRLALKLDEIIGRDFPIEKAYVIIERQPRKRSAQGAIRTATACVESQLVYHFSVLRRAKSVYLISAGKKNRVARALLDEPVARTYSERKKQTRRAFARMATLFDFACPHDFRHIRPDMADAFMQILGAIFICANDI